MSITEFENAPELVDFHEVKLGILYFFERFFVGEFNEGVNINYDNFMESANLVNAHFTDRNFGFIANRINSYSINLGDANKFNTIFPNLKAYAVVCNALFAKGIFEVENQFFSYNRKIFKGIGEAIVWIENTLKTV